MVQTCSKECHNMQQMDTLVMSKIGDPEFRAKWAYTATPILHILISVIFRNTIDALTNSRRGDAVNPLSGLRV